MKKTILLCILILQFSLSSCLPSPSFEPWAKWRFEDVRVIDAVDCKQATADILAVYLRRSYPSLKSDGIQIRLDMLDVDINPDFDIYLAVDYRSGQGTHQLPIDSEADIAWDRLIKIASDGHITVSNNRMNLQQGISTSIFRDSILDTISIEYQDRELIASPLDIRVQVFTTNTNSKQILDRTSPADSSASPPKAVSVIFAFWDVFPVYTPAQALRRWDGAHTGPLGGRHGLYNLLRTFNSHKVPLILLDLSYPSSISALDFGGDLSLIQEMVNNDRLIIPDTVPLSPIDKPLALPTWFLTSMVTRSRMISTHYNLHSSPFLFSQLSGLDIEYTSNHYAIIFSPSLTGTYTTTVQTNGNTRIIPIWINSSKEMDKMQPNRTGPSLEMLKALDRAALESNHTNELLIFGADLPNSTWADPEIARLSLQYLINRPWIHFMDQTDLLSLKPTESRNNDHPGEELGGLPNLTQLLPPQKQILDKLKKLPSSPIRGTAWQMMSSLLGPTYPSNEDLSRLRANYWIGLQDLLDASLWVDQPKDKSQCSQDPNNTELSQCVLSSEQWYLSFDAENACIRFGFVRLADGIHQIIAPGYQLMSGQSDPTFWNLNLGLQADPTISTCALSGLNGHFQSESSNDQIIFEDADKSIRKSFLINAYTLYVEYQTNQPLEISLPLTLDPWRMYQPHWSKQYQSRLNDQKWSWVLIPIFSVTTSTNGRMKLNTYKDSQESMGNIEDPNIGKTPGNFLPFPVAEAIISGKQKIWVSVSVLPVDNPNNSP
jgi:hypothetical protein